MNSCYKNYINPLLTTETNGNKSYDGKSLENIWELGIKSYLPEKPRFGVAHKNNIGRFW